MKRAIYVGNDTGLLRYGMTGTITLFESPDSSFVWFAPDGQRHGAWMTYRCDAYVAAEDQQRHCPKHP
jgi:hypothetical protein